MHDASSSPNPFAPPPTAQPGGPGYAAAGYIPPQGGHPGAGPHGPPGAYGYVPPPPPPRSLRGLGRTTAALLVVQGLLAAATAAVSAWGVLSWSRISGAPATMRLPADDAQMVLTLLRGPLAALTGIAFVAWVWIATRNARNAGAWVRHAPGWALGGWLVPFLNMWRPKQMIDDLWRASAPGAAPGTDLRRLPKPAIVTFWWAAYLIGSSLPAVGMLKTFRAVLEPQLAAMMSGTVPAVPVDMARVNETAAMWNLWGSALLVVAAGIAVVFVHRISTWQDERTAPPAARLSSAPHGQSVSG